jgi:membrane glycosyltransferase
LGREASLEEKGPTKPKVVLSERRGGRISLAILTLVTTGLGTWLFCRVAANDGIGAVGFVLAILFAILLAWVECR